MRLFFKNLSIISFSLFIFASNGLAQEASNNGADHPLDQRLLEVIQVSSGSSSDLEHVEYLLQSGVNINTTDELGRTAAMLAFSRWDTDMLMLLVKNKADVHSEDKTSHLCLDYILDVSPEGFDQKPGQSFIDIDLRQEENTNRVKLKLAFALRQFDKLTLPSQVIGVGEISPFQFEEINTPSVFYGVEGQNIIMEAIRKAVRDGYSQLGEALKNRALILEPQLVGTVGVRGASNSFSFSLGRSDSVQEGDIFGIYSGNCHNPFGPPLNEATVVIAHDYASIIEIQGRDEGIQYGDTIALFNDIDLHARKPEDDQHQQLLRLSPIPDIQVALSLSSGGILRRDITSYVEKYLVEEAPDFFRVIPITQSP